MTDAPHTIGLLYPGEMGAAVAAVLRGRGHRVVTELAGRGGRTADRCRAAGIDVLDSLGGVVRQSAVVCSLVPPAAADDVAAAYLARAAEAPAGAVYVDANSIGPAAVTAMAGRFAARGVDFVDAAINGLAKNLTTGGTLYLSGRRAGEVARLVGDAVRVRPLGDAPGRASAMKMLLSGLSKGLCALFAETALVAVEHDLLPEMTAAYAEIYPGVMAVVDRMLPTYAAHAARRATETRELEATARAARLEPRVLAAVRAVHDLLAAVPFAAADGASVTALIERLAAEGTLKATSGPLSPVLGGEG